MNEEIKKKIDAERDSYCKKHGRMTTGYYAINFDAGATFGYSLAEAEIERLTLQTAERDERILELEAGLKIILKSNLNYSDIQELATQLLNPTGTKQK